MALAYATKARIVAGNSKTAIVDFTADSAYAAGGYSLAASDFEKLTGNPSFNTTTSITFFDSEVNASGYSLSLDRANSKVLYYLGGTEATTTVSSKVVRARLVFGASNAS